MGLTSAAASPLCYGEERKYCGGEFEFSSCHYDKEFFRADIWSWISSLVSMVIVTSTLVAVAVL
jgi:hypothetical protein